MRVIVKFDPTAPFASFQDVAVAVRVVKSTDRTDLVMILQDGSELMEQIQVRKNANTVRPIAAADLAAAAYRIHKYLYGEN